LHGDPYLIEHGVASLHIRIVYYQYYVTRILHAAIPQAPNTGIHEMLLLLLLANSKVIW
jgi:hypothetical protein